VTGDLLLVHHGDDEALLLGASRAARALGDPAWGLAYAKRIQATRTGRAFVENRLHVASRLQCAEILADDLTVARCFELMPCLGDDLSWSLATPAEWEGRRRVLARRDAFVGVRRVP